MFELFLLFGLVLFALLFAKVGFALLAVLLVVLGGIALCKAGAFFFQLILLPFQLIGGLFLGLLAIPFALVAIPLIVMAVLGTVALLAIGGLALAGGLLGCL